MEKLIKLQLYFYFLEKKDSVKTIGCEMEDDFTCNKIINSVYLCAFICNYNLYIYVYTYQTINPDKIQIVQIIQ